MTSGLRFALCASTIVSVGLGCRHMAENRAIDRFSAALAASDLTDLRDATSPDFRTKALRSDGSIEDLAILKLPTDDVEIVSVEPNEELGTKDVTVRVGKSKQKLLYRLVEEDGSWVVDDVLVRQVRRGHSATRSVTEQVDLLTSVREFTDAWSSNDRGAVLDVTAPDLRRVLSALPPAYLARTTERVTGSGAKSVRKPEAQLDGDRAVVTIPRGTNSLLVSFRLGEDRTWRVTDVAVDSKRAEERMPSLLQRATALATSVAFLESFGKGDRESLAAVCTTAFHDRSLKAADLSSVSLPRPVLAASDFELTMEAHRADFVVPSDGEVVKLALVRRTDEEARGLPPVYRVEEVTLFEENGGQEKRLSSLFTAHASMFVFADALRSRDLAILRHTSSADFNRRVWERLRETGIDGFVVPDVANVAPTIVNTVFNGAVTEVTVTQGPRAMTYVLRSHEGDMLVDDVIVAAKGRPSSLKTTLEHVVPAHVLARGIADANMSLVRRSSSDDFNRLVWGQVRVPPAAADAAPPFLVMPVTSVSVTSNGATVVLGGDRRGARLNVVRERDFLVVDEVTLVAGPQSSQRVALKQRLRAEVARGIVDDEPQPSRVTFSSHATRTAPHGVSDPRPSQPSPTTVPPPSRPVDPSIADRPITMDMQSHRERMAVARRRTADESAGALAPAELPASWGDLPLE